MSTGKTRPNFVGRIGGVHAKCTPPTPKRASTRRRVWWAVGDRMIRNLREAARQEAEEVPGAPCPLAASQHRDVSGSGKT